MAIILNNGVIYNFLCVKFLETKIKNQESGVEMLTVN